MSLIKKAEWPDVLLHGTSSNGVARMRRSRSTKELYLTDDENTAYDYAMNWARRDGSTPVIVHFDRDVMRRTPGSKLRYDHDDEGDIIVEEFIYAGPLLPNMIANVEEVE